VTISRRPVQPRNVQTREALAGLVERVTFHNAENGFCALRTRRGDIGDLVTVVGQSLPDDTLVV
jgi:exodeoxyribonuclease V alpha subunit